MMLGQRYGQEVAGTFGTTGGLYQGAHTDRWPGTTTSLSRTTIAGCAATAGASLTGICCWPMPSPTSPTWPRPTNRRKSLSTHWTAASNACTPSHEGCRGWSIGTGRVVALGAWVAESPVNRERRRYVRPDDPGRGRRLVRGEPEDRAKVGPNGPALLDQDPGRSPPLPGGRGVCAARGVAYAGRLSSSVRRRPTVGDPQLGLEESCKRSRFPFEGRIPTT